MRNVKIQLSDIEAARAEYDAAKAEMKAADAALHAAHDAARARGLDYFGVMADDGYKRAAEASSAATNSYKVAAAYLDDIAAAYRVQVENAVKRAIIDNADAIAGRVLRYKREQRAIVSTLAAALDIEETGLYVIANDYMHGIGYMGNGVDFKLYIDVNSAGVAVDADAIKRRMHPVAGASDLTPARVRKLSARRLAAADKVKALQDEYRRRVRAVIVPLEVLGRQDGLRNGARVDYL